MKTLRTLCIATMLAFASLMSISGHAATADRGAEVAAYVANTGLIVMLQSMRIEAGDWNSTQRDRAKQLEELANELPAVLKAAHGHADLSRALKELEVASSTYLVSSWQDSSQPAIVVKANAAALKADYDRKVQAVKLEAKLAGLSE